MKLSQERAQAMKDYMVSQGADPEKLMTKGMGETDPIADNSTEQGRFRNRRIEFTVYDESMVNDNGNAAMIADTDTNNTGTTAMPTVTVDPDMNPLDSDNDDILPDSDDPSRGTVMDPKTNAQ